MSVILNEVWPNPSSDLLAEARRNRADNSTAAGSLQFHGLYDTAAMTCFHGENKILSVVAPRTIIHAGKTWIAPDDDLDPLWAAASVATAFRQGVREPGMLPGGVAYKALFVSANGALGVFWPHCHHRMQPPAAIMPKATCIETRDHASPVWECACGYHAAMRVSELCLRLNCTGVMIVTPTGRTIWHENAWRSAQYQVHAAVTGLDQEIRDDQWDPGIPVIRARRELIPYRAFEIAREVAALIELEPFDNEKRTAPP